MGMDIDASLNQWGEDRCQQIELASLMARNAVAHKWKATYFSIILRECIFWRMQDLLTQARHLQKSKMVLGSSILIRAALETLAVLIYQNQQTAKVLVGELNFFEYVDKVKRLSAGSKDGSTPFDALNILTLLKSCERKYPALPGIYSQLCEHAHPNHEGVLGGYSVDDRTNFNTVFANRWYDIWGELGDRAIPMLIDTFDHEYNETWKDGYEKLEIWLEANDAKLNATKPP